MKVVIGDHVGGFHPSAQVIEKYAELTGVALFIYRMDAKKNFRLFLATGKEADEGVDYVVLREKMKDGITEHSIYESDKYNTIFHTRDIERNDPNFVKAAELIGNPDKHRQTLKVIDIPDDVDFIICNGDDGSEWIAEKHRTWS